MKYEDFLSIAIYGNKEWKGNYTEEEIRQNAMNYYLNYQHSIVNRIDKSDVTTPFLLERLAEDWANGMDEVTRWLKEMITELGIIDMDYHDYTETNPYLVDFIQKEM